MLKNSSEVIKPEISREVESSSTLSSSSFDAFPSTGKLVPESEVICPSSVTIIVALSVGIKS